MPENHQSFRPARVRFVADPVPSLTLGMGDDEVDVTAAVEGFTLHVSTEAGEAHNAIVLHLRAEVELVEWEVLEALVERQAEQTEPDGPVVPLQVLQKVLEQKGYSETAEQAIRDYLARYEGMTEDGIQAHLRDLGLAE